MLSDRRWRPYVATGFLLFAAAGLNVLTHNTLWLAYTAIGIGIWLFGVGFARGFGWFLPTRAAWLLGVMAALHFGGGSMAGIHTIGGSNGLYYAFPWWDNVVHLIGSAAVAVAAVTILQRTVRPGRFALPFLAVCVAVFFGVLVELYEFSQFVFFHTVDQGYYSNTMIDIYDNLLGGVLGTWLALVMPADTVEPTAAGTATSSGSDATPCDDGANASPPAATTHAGVVHGEPLDASPGSAMVRDERTSADNEQATALP